MQVQGHGAVHKSESSDSSSGMLYILIHSVDVVSSLSTDPIPAALSRNRECILSNSKVLGLILLHGHGLAHKVIVSEEKVLVW